MKKNKTFKLSEETFARLDRLTSEESATQTYILEKALEEYELGKENFRRDFMQLYELTSKNIEKLQIKRDYSPDIPEGEGLNKEESQTLDYYFKLFDEMRQQPFFSEVVPPELDSSESGGA